jgi:threonine aldolase
VYAPDEIAALAEVAHSNGLYLHVDGARLGNAVAALGGGVRAATVDAGVDVLTFGGTKAGMTHGEAVVFLQPELGERVRFIRKQAAQLPSKMRFIAAQLTALLQHDRWIHAAGHANAMAASLAARVAEVPGVAISQPVEVNAVFATLPPAAIEVLQGWSPFWTWDEATHEVRWMCSWDTTEDDIDRFVAGIRTALAETAF